MRRSFFTLFLAFLLVAAPLTQARAGVALIAWATGGAAASIATVGGASLVSGVTLNYFSCEVLDGHRTCEGNGGIGRWFAPAFILMLVGLIALDNNSQEVLQYSPLDASAASGLGITEQEAASFNSELDQVNAVRETIMTNMLEAGKISAKAAHAQWQQYKSALSPETFTAVEKIGAQFAKVQ